MLLPNTRLNDARLSPDGTQIVTAAGDNHVYVWNKSNGQQLMALNEEKVGGEPFDLGAPFDLTPGTTPKTGYICAKFSPDGNFIAGGNEQGRVSVWDAKTGKQLLKLTGHVGRVTSLDFGLDGNRLLATGEDTKVYVWNISSKDMNNGSVRERIKRLDTSDK